MSESAFKDLDEPVGRRTPATDALSGVGSRDRAIAALRAMTRGPKGDRPDYVGTLSTADATILVNVLDRVVPLYDQHAFGAEELRYLTLYRGLNDEGRAQADKFLRYLVEREALPDTPHGPEAAR